MWLTEATRITKLLPCLHEGWWSANSRIWMLWNLTVQHFAVVKHHLCFQDHSWVCENINQCPAWSWYTPPPTHCIIWSDFHSWRYFFPGRHIIPQTRFAFQGKYYTQNKLKVPKCVLNIFLGVGRKMGACTWKLLGPMSYLLLSYLKKTSSVLVWPAELTQQDAMLMLISYVTKSSILCRTMKIKLIPNWVFIQGNNQDRYIWFINRANC